MKSLSRPLTANCERVTATTVAKTIRPLCFHFAFFSHVIGYGVRNGGESWESWDQMNIDVKEISFLRS